MNGTREEVLGYTISKGFHELMGDLQTSGFWGVKPLPRIDQIVDVAAGHRILLFLNAFSRYH